MAKKVIIVTLAALLSIFILCGCTAVRRIDENTAVTTGEADTETEKTTENTTEADTEAKTTEANEVTTAPPETTAAPETTAVADTTDTAAAVAPVQPVPSGTYPTILTYHLILDEPYTQFTNLFVKVSDFESQLQNLNAAGYNYLFADEFGEVTSKSVIITFDDGYEDNYTNMLPLLKKYNARATVFLIAYKIDKPGYLSSAQIKEMADSGLVRFGSHTSSHYDLRTIGEAQLRDELGGSKNIISSLTGQDINCVCYPAGGYNSTTLALAAEYYSYGFTTHPGKYAGEAMLELPRIAVQRGMTGTGLLWTLGG